MRLYMAARAPVRFLRSDIVVSAQATGPGDESASSAASDEREEYPYEDWVLAGLRQQQLGR